MEEQEYELDTYQRFLGEVNTQGAHWEKIQKELQHFFKYLWMKT